MALDIVALRDDHDQYACDADKELGPEARGPAVRLAFKTDNAPDQGPQKQFEDYLIRTYHGCIITKKQGIQLSGPERGRRERLLFHKHLKELFLAYLDDMLAVSQPCIRIMDC